MLTEVRVTKELLAQLMRLGVPLDADDPGRASPEDVKRMVRELAAAWSTRAFLTQQVILQEPPTGSQLLRAGSFLDPLMDVLSKRLSEMNRAVGAGFTTSLSLHMEPQSFATVHAVGPREYSIDIGLGLVVQTFLGAITLSQAGSRASGELHDPYLPQHGPGARAIYDSQAPLLAALRASAFEPLLPSEPWRRLLAYEFFAKAIEFALLHEFGHAARGHLEFLASRGLSPTRSEEAPAETIAPLTHQLLESQADDYAAAFLAMKWRHLLSTHDFAQGPRMLGRYGYCVTRPEQAHLIMSHAWTLLFFILDAMDRRAQIRPIDQSERLRLYPSPGYRSWRSWKWQNSLKTVAAPWRNCVEGVREDLAADGFPHAEDVFSGQLEPAAIEDYDRALSEYARADGEGRALLAHEGMTAERIAPLPRRDPPRFWGEASVPLRRRVARFVANLFRGGE